MIVSGGENVFPREVEDLLANHEAIDEAAVIGVDDEKFGQRLKAFVVTSSGADLDEAGVKDYVKENLARYKVPREVEFIDELPRNPTGKVLKRELADNSGEILRFASGLPGGAAVRDGMTCVLPQPGLRFGGSVRLCTSARRMQLGRSRGRSRICLRR